jgi:Xaa-Pro aminopeptidase
LTATRWSNDSPKDRRKGLAGKLSENNLDLAIISNPKHIFYFTGFASNLNMYLTLTKGPRSTSFLAIKSDSSSFLLLGKSELSNPWNKKKRKSKKSQLNKIFDGEVTTYVDYDPDKRVVVYGDFLSGEFSKWLKKFSSRSDNRVGIEEWHLAESYQSVISNFFEKVQLVGLSRIIRSMRRVKGMDEIKNLKSATKMLDFAYTYANLISKPGKKELDIYREMNYQTFRKFGPFGWVMGDHISGERSLEVGGLATDRVLKRGDTVILDLQTSYNNYWSDLCRTFVVGGKPTEHQRRVAHALIKSLERAEDLMKPGVKCKDIYNAVNNVITSSGYPKIPHHVGHSIGLDDQELPWFIPSSEEELEEGMVCVVEPGIYTKMAGGMRVEDAYIITKEGNEKISHYPLFPT